MSRRDGSAAPPAGGLLGLRDRVDRALEVALVALMTAMVLNVLWQVLTRFVLRSPSSYTEELARFMLIWLGLLGACYALRRGMHLAVDVLVAGLEGRAGKTVALLSLVSVGGFAVAVLLVGGLHLVLLTRGLEQTSAALGLSLGHVYLALPLAGLLVVFYAVTAGIELLGGGAGSGD